MPYPDISYILRTNPPKSQCTGGRIDLENHSAPHRTRPRACTGARCPKSRLRVAVTVTYWDLVTTAADEHPNRVVVADQYGRALTTVGLRDAAEQTAAGLSITADDVVSWQLPTVLESVVLMTAAARVGAVQNPIVPLLRERELRLMTSQLGTTKLIVPTWWHGFDHAAMARAVAADTGIEVTTLDLAGSPGDQLRLPLHSRPQLDSPPVHDAVWRWAHYTSGTTAAPKGVRHTDASVVASSRALTERWRLRPTDVYPIAWPFTHIGGAAMLASVLSAGGRLVLFDSFDPVATPERMARCAPTILGTATPFFRAYIDAQRRHGPDPLYPDLRVFVAGGAATPAEVIADLAKTFPVVPLINTWGLTEFPVAASSLPIPMTTGLAASVGAPTRGVQARVVSGELRLKGPQQLQGYVDPAADSEAFDADGWFRTGDVGDVDDAGAITITGRIKDVIIRNAENISALEIEDVLLRHPDIADVAVVGIPDRITGERVCAVIVPVHGRHVTLETVADQCAAEGLVRQKTPAQVKIVDRIARNAMGKIVKSDVRAHLLRAVGEN